MNIMDLPEELRSMIGWMAHPISILRDQEHWDWVDIMEMLKVDGWH